MLEDFFGFNGYQREAEGFLSWQHLTFVSFLLVCTVTLAMLLARRHAGSDDRTHSRTLLIAAIVMDGVEIIKVALQCTLGGDPFAWLNSLPLYLCSIQFFTLPLCALAKGRLRASALDFVAMFGMLGAVLGTYCAGNNYACYPVLSFDNVVSGVTHSAAGFASLYIMLTGMARMHKRNMGIACGLILLFSALSYAVNLPLGTNYMFLMRGDGTPYDLLFNLVPGSPVLYPLGVVGLLLVYIFAAYQLHALVCRLREKRTVAKAAATFS